MSNVVKLTEEQGEELSEASYTGDAGIEINGRTYRLVSEVDNFEDHRWCTTSLLVFKRDDDELYGMRYDYGKTESQESGFVYSDPELWPVKEEVVTKSEYSLVKVGA